MPSKLFGLIRKLRWDEFKGQPTTQALAELTQAASNAPGKTVGMAGIFSDFTVSFGGNHPDVPVLTAIAGSSPQTFTLADNVNITVSFNGTRSWKRLDPLTAKGEEFLLDHEQGHYDISALMARDCFIDLMQLKAKTFGSEQEGQKAATDTIKGYKDKLDPIQKKYDDDTTHGAWVTPSLLPERKESFQNKWEFLFERAFTEERQPDLASPVDKVSYKIRLLDVLFQRGGFTF